MSENTGIRIEAIEEVHSDGEQGYRITKIQALPKKDLPRLYVDSKERPAVYYLDPISGYGEHRLYLTNNNRTPLPYISTQFYYLEEMKKINTHIKAAGQHLADVNAHLRKERESWSDTVTFVDGVEVISKETVRPWEPWLKSQTETVLSKKPSAEQLYTIADGSWNLCSTNAGITHIPDLAMASHNKYRILNQGCDLPAHQGPARTLKRNDTILQNIETGQLVFTCARFLCQI